MSLTSIWLYMLFVALPWVPMWLLVVVCAGYAVVAAHNAVQARR